ncbi:hypothetical protein AnigIFM63326_011277 [Aspergillus niger]|nr:hypothetical protein AnigIFM63326_011277 [Aspergillus niger]
MQAQINVRIRAINQNTWATYQLTQSDLQSLKLIDYNKRQELTGNWTYSTVEKEEFAHNMPITRSPADEELVAPVTPIADDTQTIIFWVSATRIESLRIGAQITEHGATESTVTTTGGNFDPCITVRGHAPITYTMNDVTVQREDTAYGFWYKQVRENGKWIWYTYAWDQDNYYLTSKRYPFVKIDHYNVDVNGSTQPNGNGGYFRDAFAYMGLGNDSEISIFFLPQMGNSQQSRRGVRWINDYNDLDSTAYVTVNQRPNALILTRILFGNAYVSFLPNWQEDAWFRIYDQYGNSGTFTAKQQGSNTIAISNRYVNRDLSAEESKTIQPAAKL